MNENDTTPGLFTPDPDAGALDRAVMTLAGLIHAAGDPTDAAESIASNMAYIREAVRNPNPQGPHDPPGVVEQLRAIAENATAVADSLQERGIDAGVLVHVTTGVEDRDAREEGRS